MLVALFSLAAQLVTIVGCRGLPTPIPTPTPTPTVPSPTPTATPPVPTPAPTTPIAKGATQSYVRPILGISLTFPQDWLLRETKDGVVFGTSERVIAGGELTEGAGLSVSVDPLPNAQWENVEELCASRASVFRSERMEIGEAQGRHIGGRPGAIVNLRGIPGLGETPIRGLVAVTVWGDRAYTFVAVAVEHEWDTHVASLEATIESVQFIPMELAEYGPDPWEPDDTLGDATEVRMSASQSHDLHTLGDRDYVRFEATRGHVYTIETANLGPEIDTSILLFDAEGKLLAHNDDARALEEPWASRLVWTAEKTNTLYVMIRDVGDDDAGPGTSYDVTVWEQVHFVEDEYEPDDSPDLATLLKPAEPQPHNLHVPGDQDWLRLQATAGHTYVIETFNLGPSVDTVLHLLDELGNELAWDDNGRAEEEALASRIQWRAVSDIQLWVMIHDSGDDDGGPGTEYRLRLVEK